MKEVIYHITPHGNFKEYREVTATRYFTGHGWTLTKVNEAKIPEHEPCISYRSPTVDQFSKAERIRITEGYAISKLLTRVVDQCVEEKVVNIVEYKGVKFSYAGDPSDIPTVIDYLRETVKETTQLRVFSLERTYGILDPEATLHLFHHVISMLRADRPMLKLEERFSQNVTVFDDPLNPNLIGFSTFDDEGVRTRRKEVIGDGYVLSYLETLGTGEPGNARGVIPKPDYFNLIVKNGDWSLEELREETKEGLIITGVERSELVKNSIRIFPRRVTLIGKGDIVVREIAIPLQELLTIDALTKEARSGYIDDQHGGVAPYLRMKVRPIIY